MLTLIDEHPMGRKPVNGQDMKWSAYLAQVAPWRCELNGPGKKELLERDAARRHRWARAVLHLLFPVKDATGFEPHPMEDKPVTVFDMTWTALLVQACRLAPLEPYDKQTEKEEMEMFLADAWARVEWAKAMLHEFFPAKPAEPITVVERSPS